MFSWQKDLAIALKLYNTHKHKFALLSDRRKSGQDNSLSHDKPDTFTLKAGQSITWINHFLRRNHYTAVATTTAAAALTVKSIQK